MSDNPQIYTKVVDLLEKNLSKDEFLELHELLDSDPDDVLFWMIVQKATKMAPEQFVLSEGDAEKIVEEVWDSLK